MDETNREDDLDFENGAEDRYYSSSRRRRARRRWWKMSYTSNKDLMSWLIPACRMNKLMNSLDLYYWVTNAIHNPQYTFLRLMVIYLQFHRYWCTTVITVQAVHYCFTLNNYEVWYIKDECGLKLDKAIELLRATKYIFYLLIFLFIFFCHVVFWNLHSIWIHLVSLQKYKTRSQSDSKNKASSSSRW